VKFLEKWQRVWMAVAFAEANELETARQLIKPSKSRPRLEKRNRVYA